MADAEGAEQRGDGEVAPQHVGQVRRRRGSSRRGLRAGSACRRPSSPRSRGATARRRPPRRRCALAASSRTRSGAARTVLGDRAVAPLAGHADGAEQHDEVGDRVVGEQLARGASFVEVVARTRRGRPRAARARAHADDAANVRVVRSLSSSACSSGVHARAPVSAKNAVFEGAFRGGEAAARPPAPRPAIAPTCSGVAPRTSRTSPARSTSVAAALERARQPLRDPARGPRSPGPSSPPSTCSSVPCARSSPSAMTTTSSTDCATSASTWLETSTARAVRGLLAQQAAQPADARRVEAVGRLVEDQHLGVAEQRGGDGQALAHAQRVALDAAVGGVGEADGVEHLVDAARRVLAGERRGPAGGCGRCGRGGTRRPRARRRRWALGRSSSS